MGWRSGISPLVWPSITLPKPRGSGAIWRGSLGILTFALIGNGLNLLGVDTTYQQTILGLLIFAAVAADQVFRRKSA